MNDLRKAAEMALEALEWNYGTDLENIENCTAWLDKMNAIIPALRQALDDKPLVKTYAGGKPNYCTPEVTGEVTRDVDAANMSQESVDETAKGEHEPWPSVQCVCGGTIYFKYTPPVSDYHEGWEEGFEAAKRDSSSWVGLTDEDKEGIKNKATYNWDTTAGEYASEVQALTEAKLKEKNGG